MTNHITIPKLSEELAYLCGVIAGDGCISIRESRHDYAINCAGNAKDEREFYDTILKPLIRNVFGLEVVMRLHSKGVCYGFTISSKALAGYLVEVIGMPVGKKYANLRIPLLFKNNSSLCTAYVRGLFDTDGCVSFKKRNANEGYYPVISFSSKSNRFAYEVAWHLTRIDLLAVTTIRIAPEPRFGDAYNFTTTVELNGTRNFELWQDQVQFWNPKHRRKIILWKKKKKYLNRAYKKNDSGGRI